MSIVPLPGVISTLTPANEAIWPAQAPAADTTSFVQTRETVPVRSSRSVTEVIRPPLVSMSTTRW